MAQLQCPHCHKTLHLPHEITRAKLKCKHCQSIFVASTKSQSPGPGGAGQEQPAAQKRPEPAARDKAVIHRHPRNRRKPGKGAFVVTIVGAVVLIALVAVASYLYLYPSLHLQFDDGEVWFSGRISRSLRDQKIEEFRNLKDARRADAGQDGNGQDEQVVVIRPPDSQDGQQTQPDPQNPPQQQQQQQQNPPDQQPQTPAGPKLEKDPKVRIEGIRRVSDTGGSNGHVVALLSNDYDMPIRQASVQFYFFNEAGAHHPLKPQSVQYIPPKTRIPISAPYNVAEKIDRIDYSLTNVTTDENLIVTMVPLNYDQQQRLLTGWISYTGQRAMNNPRMYVEFFDDNNARIHSVMFESLEDAPAQLDKGKGFFFKKPVANALLLVPDRIEARLLGQAGIQF
ncbi:MAG: hypothetical protein ACOCZE_11025 [Planctomycetota bacterium]